MRKPGPFSALSSIRKNFFDNFNRNDTEDGLGNAPDGRLWDKVRGVFQVIGGNAFSDTDSDYPIASVNMPYEDVEISLSLIDNGSAAALWVTDSGNWWGLGLEQEEVDCNCSFGTECNRWNQGGLCNRWNVGNCSRWNARNCRRESCAEWTCQSFNARNCRSWSVTSSCSRWQFFAAFGQNLCYAVSYTRTCSGGFNTSNCISNVCVRNECTRWNARNCNRWNTGSCNRWTEESCNQWFEFSFDCQKCYPQWIRVIQSINSTITTKARFLITKTFTEGTSPEGGLTDFRQTTFINKAIESIKIFIKGKNIEADLFYSQDFSDKVDVAEKITYSATGAEVNTSYGILIVPSENAQNTIIGSIEIDKN